MESAPIRLERRPRFLATSLRGDELIRWFEDEVLRCLSRDGVQATLDYIAEERRSWHAACVGAETCRPSEPLGLLACDEGFGNYRAPDLLYMDPQVCGFSSLSSA